MGLSIISKSNGRTAPLAPSGQTNTAIDELEGLFATLLSSQTPTAMNTASATNTPIEGSIQSFGNTELHKLADIDGKAETGPKKSDKTESDTTIGPAALIAMIGNPQIQPETGKHCPKTEDFPKESQANDPSLLISPSNTPPALLLNTNSPTSSATGSREQTVFTAVQTLDSKTRTDPLPEKAANIAAELSENTGSATSFAANISNTLLQHRITNAHQTLVSAPLHGEAWPQQFCEKIVWLAKNDQQSAQINITPPQLGPVQITLNLNGDQATALFSSPHAEVRQAIENSLPHLREMLASAGISLGDANVGTNLAQQNQNNPFMMANENQSTHENAILPANGNAPATSIGQVLQKGRGLVDLFA